MSDYRTNTDELTIGFGPGAVHLSGDVNIGWVSADVGLAFDYGNYEPSMTRAALELIAEKVDPNSSSDEVHVTIELTKDDLLTLRGTVDSLLVAIEEDDAT